MPDKKTTPNKSEFIRQHPSLSTAEIIAAGKKSGLKISSSLVYVVRGRTAKPKGAVAKKTTASTSAAPTSTSTSTRPTQSKADFVRAHTNLSPKEIVKKAKAEGVKLGVSYVYNVRGADKSTGRTKVTAVAARRSAVRTAPPVPRPITTSSSAETLLKALGAELGLGRAIEILAGERARVRAVIGGG
jgi:hypothetical protein